MRKNEPDIGRLRATFLYCPLSGNLSYYSGELAGFIDKRGYRVVKFEGRQIFAHNIAWALMTGAFPKGTVDHRDLDGANNRWGNLREASEAQQQVNRRLFKNNKTGFRGVYMDHGRFRAMVRIDGKTIHLGSFGTAAEAAAVVQKAREDRWGEFAVAS
jgi:hypothetical protein